MTKVDAMLRSLIEGAPDWRDALAPDEAKLVELRLEGLSLKELAARTGLTKPGVRFKLYGAGHGGCRCGGALGKLRGLHRTRLLKPALPDLAVGG